MAQLIGAFLTVFLVLPAQAEMEVTCLKEGACLSMGWEVDDYASGGHSIVRCEDNDCLESGWKERRSGHINAWGYQQPFAPLQARTLVTKCKDNGCYESGWRTYRQNYGGMVGEVRCLEGESGEGLDCLTNGWRVYIYNGPYRRYTAEIECIDNNCWENGWDIYYTNGRYEVVTCKNGGCFHSGWRVRP